MKNNKQIGMEKASFGTKVKQQMKNSFFEAFLYMYLGILCLKNMQRKVHLHHLNKKQNKIYWNVAMYRLQTHIITQKLSFILVFMVPYLNF